MNEKKTAIVWRISASQLEILISLSSNWMKTKCNIEIRKINGNVFVFRSCLLTHFHMCCVREKYGKSVLCNWNWLISSTTACRCDCVRVETQPGSGSVSGMNLWNASINTRKTSRSHKHTCTCTRTASHFRKYKRQSKCTKGTNGT